jgi:hypothetical protein
MADSSGRYVCRAETVRAPVVALNGCSLAFTCHSLEILDRPFLAQLCLSASNITEPNFCSCQMKYRFSHHVVTEFHAA